MNEFTFSRNPTIWLQSISALLTIIVTFGLDFLSADNATAIVAVLSALIGAFNAFKVRPIAPAAITAVLTTGAALLAGYGLNLSPELIGAVTVAVPTFLMLTVRQQVTPVDDPKPAEVVVG